MWRFEDTDKYRFGREGEKWLRIWVQHKGYHVVALSDIDRNGGTPVAESSEERIILPDDLLLKDGKPLFVEYKTKSRITYNQIRHRYEHGIPVRLWNDYRAIEIQSGIDGVLIILQLTDPKILIGLLKNIAKGSAVYSGSKFPEPMIFFDVNCFDRFDLRDGSGHMVDSLPQPKPPSIIHPWEKRKPLEGRQYPLM